MTPVELSWHPEAEDLADALRAHRPFSSRRRRLSYPVGFGVLALVIAGLLAAGGEPGSGEDRVRRRPLPAPAPRLRRR